MVRDTRATSAPEKGIGPRAAKSDLFYLPRYSDALLASKSSANWLKSTFLLDLIICFQSI